MAAPDSKALSIVDLFAMVWWDLLASIAGFLWSMEPTMGILRSRTGLSLPEGHSLFLG